MADGHPGAQEEEIPEAGEKYMRAEDAWKADLWTRDLHPERPLGAGVCLGTRDSEGRRNEPLLQTIAGAQQARLPGCGRTVQTPPPTRSRTSSGPASSTSLRPSGAQPPAWELSKSCSQPKRRVGFGRLRELLLGNVAWLVRLPFLCTICPSHHRQLSEFSRHLCRSTLSLFYTQGS